MIADAMIVSKGITLLEHTAMFNKDIREWRNQTTYKKTWAHFNIFFHRSHREQRKAVKTAGKGGYNTAVQNIYGVPPPTPEEHHEEINHINTIVQGTQAQSYDMEGLAQDNAILTRSNTTVMAHMTVTMNAMQAQLKTITPAPTNQKSSKRK